MNKKKNAELEMLT